MSEHVAVIETKLDALQHQVAKLSEVITRMAAQEERLNHVPHRFSAGGHQVVSLVCHGQLHGHLVDVYRHYRPLREGGSVMLSKLPSVDDKDLVILAVTVLASLCLWRLDAGTCKEVVQMVVSGLLGLAIGRK